MITGTVAGRQVTVLIEADDSGDAIAVEVALRREVGRWPGLEVRDGTFTCQDLPRLAEKLMTQEHVVSRWRQHEQESRYPDTVLLTRAGAVRTRDRGDIGLLQRGAQREFHVAVNRALPAALELADAVDAFLSSEFPELPWAVLTTSAAAYRPPSA